MGITQTRRIQATEVRVGEQFTCVSFKCEMLTKNPRKEYVTALRLSDGEIIQINRWKIVSIVGRTQQAAVLSLRRSVTQRAA
jgi:hypothetical protein